jgi:[protein-PII] uridylyltransferase
MHSITTVRVQRLGPPPDGSRQGVDPVATAEHFRVAEDFRVAARRTTGEAEVSVFRTAQHETTGLCVIADDKPGLLAAISEALLLNGLDVVSARIYTRTLSDGKVEAVDLFWVRPQVASADASSCESDLASRVQETLLGILSGRNSVARLTPGTAHSLRAPTTTLVRFIEDGTGGFSTLEVETGDRSGLLLTITRALSLNDVQIIGSLVNTTGALVFDRFQLRERDGSTLNPARRRQLQQAVLAALDIVATDAA